MAEEVTVIEPKPLMGARGGARGGPMGMKRGIFLLHQDVLMIPQVPYFFCI